MQDEGKFWDDPEGAWRKAMARRAALNLVIPVFTLSSAILFIAFGIVMLFMMSKRVTYAIISVDSLLFVLGVVMLIFSVSSFRTMRRDWNLTALLNEAQGKLCPRCRSRLRETADIVVLECQECSRTIVLDEVLTYWREYASSPAKAAIRLSDWTAFRSNIFTRRLATLQYSVKGNPKNLVRIPILIFGIYGIIGALTDDMGFFIGLINNAFFPMFNIGVALIIYGYVTRTGESRHCATCEFQQAPTGPTPDRCPECGANWQTAKAVVTGRKVFTQNHVRGGIGLVLLSLLLFILPMFDLYWEFKLLSTEKLIGLRVNSIIAFEEWAELQRRTLTPAQEILLADGLLDQRIRDGYIAADADSWLVALMNGGKLPINLAVRYYSEFMEFELTAPQQAKVGEKVNVQLVSVCRWNSGSGNPVPYVFIGAYVVDGQERLESREPVAVHGISMPDHESGIDLTAGEVGEIHVSLELWVVFSTSPLFIGDIVWQEDGSPLLMPLPKSHSQKITLEHVIEVTK